MNRARRFLDRQRVRSTLGCLLWMLAGTHTAWAQLVPDEPPYCKAGQTFLSNEFGNGEHTADGSAYCLNRIVDNAYATPPEGWDMSVPTFGKLTAFYPSVPVTDGWPVPPNYPHVVITFNNDPGGYPNWPDHTIGDSMTNALPGVDPTYHQVDLVRVFDCVPTDFTCEYEIRPLTADIGNPPEWFEASIPIEVDGNGAGLDLFPFGRVSVGIGLVADGNHAPKVKLNPEPVQDLSYQASIVAEDPDADTIVGYVFDWGDGTVTPEQASNMSGHTYAAIGNYLLTGYAIDARGAVGSFTGSIGNFVTVTADGPHTVPVGGHISVKVTLTNAGLEGLDVRHDYGFKSGAAPGPGVLKVATTPDTFSHNFEHGDMIDGTYGIDALKDGTVTFVFGSASTINACPECNTTRTYIEYPLVIGNGGGGATPTPSATPTAVATPDAVAIRKCRTALVGAGSILLGAEAKAENTCTGKIVSGRLPAGTVCRDDAKTAAAIAKTRAKLVTTVDKACGGKDKTCAAGGDDLPLAGVGFPIGACPNVLGGDCIDAVTDCSGIATCLTCIGESTVDRTLDLATGALVPTDPKNKAEKALNKCQATIAKATAAFLAARSTALGKCWAAVAAGKASGVCPAADGKTVDAITKAETKKTAAICKACGGADKNCDGANDFTPNEIGFAPSCPDVTPPGASSCAGAVTTLQELTACVDCVATFASDCSAFATAATIAPYPPECAP